MEAPVLLTPGRAKNSKNSTCSWHSPVLVKSQIRKIQALTCDMQCWWPPWQGRNLLEQMHPLKNRNKLNKREYN